MKTSQRLSITSVGGLLPQDILDRIANGDRDVEGLRAEDYHLSGERTSDAILRAWSRLRTAWAAFDAARNEQGETGGPLTGLTLEKWLLPLFAALDYGRLTTAEPVTIGDDSYKVSHEWQGVPIHLVGAGVDLDRRQKGVRGAAAMSPHSLMQVLLNRDPNSLWGIISNGLRLRVLRDSASLTRQAYLEFDLEAMFAGDLYADFALFWLVAHQSGLESRIGETCWLEKWLGTARTTGIRALDDLRRGVEGAIAALGQGYLGNPENRQLRDALQGGALTPHGYYQQLLRLVYRLIFVMVAEARGLLLDPAAPAEAHKRYLRYYTLERLRDLARRPTSGPSHGDLYEEVKLVMGLLAGRGDARALGLSVLNGFLFSETTTPHLDDLRLANGSFLEALRALCYTTERDGRVRPVDFRALGAEELGSVYESLLELVPEISSSGATFNLINVQGNDRKTTGSYYTPTSLITLLLDSALEPVIERALKSGKPEDSLLGLRVIDPACGSGHFLVAAAQRLARHLARVRTGEPEPAPSALQHALRDVVRSCIYGVDVNPMSVELAKVSLWLEALEPGRPLSFLDHHLRVGNSLIGLGPNQVVTEIPDDAFSAVTGDDKRQAAELRKFNKKVRSGQMMLALGLSDADSQTYSLTLAAERRALDVLPEDTPEQIAAKAAAFAESEAGSAHARLKAEADLWTAAFFWPIEKDTDPAVAPTHATLTDLRTGSPTLFTVSCVKAAAEICGRVHAFHWPLAYPEVAAAGGFDVVLGNPPWERIKLQEEEFFATRSPEIAQAPNKAARQKLIAALAVTQPGLYEEYTHNKHSLDAMARFSRHSDRFPLSGSGDVNTYALFAELFGRLLAPTGWAGLIVPTGIATDDATKLLFSGISDSQTLVSLFDFENSEGIFPGVHRSYRFSLLTLCSQKVQSTDFAFFNTRIEHLSEPHRHYRIASNEIALFNPNTRTAPVFRNQSDAELAKMIYLNVPVFVKEGAEGNNGWNVNIGRLFHTSEDSGLFVSASRDTEGVLPLYEAKCLWHYDHRYATFENEYTEVNLGRKEDPDYIIETKYAVAEPNIPAKYRSRLADWFLAYRRITSVTNERTLVSSIIPRCGLLDSGNIIFIEDATAACLLLANFNALVVDYLCRQTMAGNNLHVYILQQLPVFPRSALLEADIAFVVPRALELMYTASDLSAFAASAGYCGMPFKWDARRRATLRAELDAYYAKLYGLTRKQLRYVLDPHGLSQQELQDILDPWEDPTCSGPHLLPEKAALDFPGETFRVLKEHELREHGEYRTRRLILEAWDRLQ